MSLTETLDLRGGVPCWNAADAGMSASDPLPDQAEIAIVGAGVMGAMLAERLSQEGRKVVVLDRRAPARGATAASTALVMWAADVPLSYLGERIGGDAADAWRQVHRAVIALGERIGGDTEAVRWKARPELYLAGSLLDDEALAVEAQLRRKFGLPSTFLPADAVAERFDLPPRAALLSEDAFQVDPVALTLCFLDRARRAGATLSFPQDVETIDEDGQGVTLHLAGGASLRAKRLILATGYEAARWYLPPAFALASSYAIATLPGMAPAWQEKAMIWEAASPYLYARQTFDGRIIIGGEDIDSERPETRDGYLAQKRGTLEAKGAALLGLDALHADCAWASTFGTSPDGLPAIGRARNAERVWLAYGFGGNGISFASLASDILARQLRGEEGASRLFDPYR